MEEFHTRGTWYNQPTRPASFSPWVCNNNERLKTTPHTGLVLEEEGGGRGGKKTNSLGEPWVLEEKEGGRGGKKTNTLGGPWVLEEKEGGRGGKKANTLGGPWVLEEEGGRGGEKTNTLGGPWVEKWYELPIRPTSFSPWVCNKYNNKRLQTTPHTGFTRFVLEEEGGGKKTNMLRGPWVDKREKWHKLPIRPTSFSPWVCNNNYNNKRLKTTPHTGFVLEEEEEEGGGGKWDDMPRDVLIKIFSLLPFQHALHHSGFAPVCKSWLYAAVDIVYPPFTTVIDLRFLATIPFDKKLRLRYMVYLKVMLDIRPHTQWTTLYLPDKIIFSKDHFLYIAQRTPCLQYLDWPYCGHFLLHEHWKAISSWKNLKGIDLGTSLGNDKLKSWLPCFAYYFKNLRSLRLVGRFEVEDVSEIIKTLFPQLEYFSLRDSSLTMDAASLVVSEVVATNNINNSRHQVGIQTLDLRHCVFISSRSGYSDLVVKQRLVEVEIHEKAVAAIKTYLRCEGLELCSQCKVKHPTLWSFFYNGGRKFNGLSNRGSSSWNQEKLSYTIPLWNNGI